MTKVAVSKVRNLHDARYCAGMGADWVCFPIDPALPDAVSQADFAEIAGWITGPLLFGEVGDASGITLSDYSVDGLITDSDAVLSRFAGALPVAWRVCLDALGSEEELRGVLAAKAKQANWFLIESEGGWEGEKATWVAKCCADYPIVAHFQFTPETAVETASLEGLLGIGLQGGTELKVGLNDFDGLADVMEALEVED